AASWAVLVESGTLANRYVCDRTMSRCIALIDQPLSMNRLASQSSNSGCEGGWPFKPKLEGVDTSPLPKGCCQRRVALTRAVRGFSGAVNQRANSNRPLLPGGITNG